MGGRRRTDLEIAADRWNREQLSRLGREVRAARKRRRLTQEALGDRVGVGRMTVSRLERGLGGGLSLDAWQRIAIALGTRLHVSIPRDADEQPADAGHLAMQELVLRLARARGASAFVELPTKPAEPWRSIDVAIADDTRHLLTIVECWNTIGDIGAAARGSNRKLAEGEAIAAARWAGSGRAALVWIIRASARNRALVARYPEVFAARFPGSSTAWARALAGGAEPPREPGLVWASVDGTRIFPWRRR